MEREDRCEDCVEERGKLAQKKAEEDAKRRLREQVGVAMGWQVEEGELDLGLGWERAGSAHEKLSKAPPKQEKSASLPSQVEACEATHERPTKTFSKQKYPRGSVAPSEKTDSKVGRLRRRFCSRSTNEKEPAGKAWRF